MKVALLIDGGHLRENAKRSGRQYTPDLVEAFAHACIAHGEHLLRVLYYDSPLYRGQQKKPISKEIRNFEASDDWIDNLSSRDLFAFRKGTLAWRGWALRKIPSNGRALTDDDFRPRFEQKGVDMRIGLDIASMSYEKTVDRVILVSADADMIPALKHARKAGLQAIGIQLPSPAAKLGKNILAHLDFKREVGWP